MKANLTFRASALAALLLSTLTLPTSTFAQGTAFTYQGRLNDGANAASGIYDLRFAIYDALAAGAQQGVALTNASTLISNGLFTVTLDFGNQFPGADRWLEIAVRTNGGGAFTTLLPRQQVTATPYAVTAGAVTGDVAASQVTGTIPLAQLPAAVVTNGASDVNINGTFSGDLGGVTNVNLLHLNSYGAFSFLTNYYGDFTLGPSPAVGDAPESLTAADVNGDGRLDLISADGVSDTLTVLTNKGAGSFALSAALSVGDLPRAVVAADVNGDGKADLISANSGGNSLSVLTNNGSGGFATAASPSVGANPRAIAAADINGDGKPDLISANTGGSTLTVLTNNGAGGFVLSASLSVGGQPRAVTTADVNGDSKLDLICANDFSNTLTVLTNNGSGGFVLSSSPAVGTNPRSVTAVDVNGDAGVDLISANFGSGTLSVLTNNGSGGFALSSAPFIGSLPVSVTTTDVNLDGRADLVCAAFQTNQVLVLTNNGSGGFAFAPMPFASYSGLIAVIAADIDGDGQADLINANFVTDSLTVWFKHPTYRVLFNHPHFTGSFTVTGGFVGNGNALTNLNAANLTGTVPDARLSGNVAKLNTTQTFTGANTFANAANSFTGNGGGLTNLKVNVLQASDGVPAQAVFVDADGNVGLGTTNPDGEVPNAGLRVANDGHVVVDNNYGFFSVNDSGSGLGAGVDTTPDDELQLFANGAALVYVKTNGNVGIGTNNPASKLHVMGSVTTDGFHIVTATTNSPVAGGILTALSGYVTLTPTNAVTLHAATAIANGGPPGQMLILRGSSDANTVTINDNANTALGDHRVLGLNDILALVWNGSDWVETSFTNN